MRTLAIALLTAVASAGGDPTCEWDTTVLALQPAPSACFEKLLFDCAGTSGNKLCEAHCRACPCADDGAFAGSIGPHEIFSMAEVCKQLGVGWSGATLSAGTTAAPSATAAPTAAATSAAPVDCEVTAWSDWGGCSVSCGSGTWTRTRIIKEAQGGGAACSKGIDGYGRGKSIASKILHGRRQSTMQDRRGCNEHLCPPSTSQHCNCDPRVHLARDVVCRVKCGATNGCRMRITHPGHVCTKQHSEAGTHPAAWPWTTAQDTCAKYKSLATTNYHRCIHTSRTECACCDCAEGEEHKCSPGTSQNERAAAAPTKGLSCTPCAAGSYTDKAGMPTCIPCAAGHYADKAGMPKCEPCPRGAVVATTGSLGCGACAAGHYADVTGLTHCQTCSAGRSSFGASGTGCLDCFPGTYALEGAATCTSCGALSFQPASGQSACIAVQVQPLDTHYLISEHTAAADRVYGETTVCEGGEYETNAPTATSDRVCASHSMCAADQFETEAPGAHSDRECRAVRKCGATEFESTPPTATSDRACTLHSACIAGTFEVAPPGPFSDRSCQAWSTCAAGTFETSAPSAAADRACSAHTTCSAVQWEAVAAGTHADRVCKAYAVCSTEEWESKAPTATADRACTAHTTCSDVQWESYPAGDHSDRECKDHTTCSGAQWESTAPTAFSDRGCSQATTCTTDQWESTALAEAADRECTSCGTCGHGEKRVECGGSTPGRCVYDCHFADNCFAAPNGTPWLASTSSWTKGSFPTFPETVGIGDRKKVLLDSNIRGAGVRIVMDGIIDLDGFKLEVGARTCTALEYSTKEPTITSDRHCPLLTVCTPSEWESSPPAAQANRVCTPLTTCAASGGASQFVAVEPSHTSDRECQAHVVCSATQWEAKAAGPKHDRQCREHTVCTGTEHETRAAATHHDRQCVPLAQCTGDEYEAVAPTTTSDRVCATKTVCSAAQFELAPPTYIADRRCQQKVCSTCDGGEPALGTACAAEGGPECATCHAGFMQAGTRCIDVDECADGRNGKCEQLCTNMPGSYECGCRSGWFMAGALDNFHPCKRCDALPNCSAVQCSGVSNSACTACNAGYKLRNGICEDRDECAASNGGCEGTCTNIAGSRTCSCPPGKFAPTATACAACPALVQCTDVRCSTTDDAACHACAAGYVLRSGKCEDRDECAAANGGCEGTCTNTVGSRACSCAHGKFLSGDVACLECGTLPNCLDARCAGSAATIECAVCAAGYSVGGGGRCEDIDECAESSPCDQQCANTAGSYSCSCEANFVARGDSCVGPLSSVTCAPTGPVRKYTGAIKHVSLACNGPCHYTLDAGHGALMGDFLTKEWHCDTCTPGSKSTSELIEPFAVTGWRRTSGSAGSALRYHLEGSVDDVVWRTICASVAFDGTVQHCDGSVVRYVRIAKDAGTTGAINGYIELHGRTVPKTCAAPVYKCARKQQLYAGQVTHVDHACAGSACRGSPEALMADFMVKQWHCDTCGAGSTSTAELIKPFYVSGWKRESGSRMLQTYHLEGSADNQSWSTICPTVAFDGSVHACDDKRLVKYVRLVKDSGAEGPWNGPIQLLGTPDCKLDLLQ